MLVLGIESSCDECAAAVVHDTRHVIASIVSSQIDLHAVYGGVVPEIAARRHVETILPVLEETLSVANVGWTDLDAIAVTRGPGLVGSLLVGVSAAKALAWVHQLPILGVNHLEGHICATLLADPPPELPAICLIVSGGHTDLLYVEDWGVYRWLGGTLDDAAGETLDKVARKAGLGYPGGPVIDRLSKAGRPDAFSFPRSWLGGGYDFSFSGLKTAVIRAAGGASPISSEDLAASVQEAVVEVLVGKTMLAAETYSANQVLLTGGVAANSRLRDQMEMAAKTRGLQCAVAPRVYCTDNAAMIAVAGSIRLQKGLIDDLEFNADPSLELTGAA